MNLADHRNQIRQLVAELLQLRMNGTSLTLVTHYVVDSYRRGGLPLGTNVVAWLETPVPPGPAPQDPLSDHDKAHLPKGHSETLRLQSLARQAI